MLSFMSEKNIYCFSTNYGVKNHFSSKLSDFKNKMGYDQNIKFAIFSLLVETSFIFDHTDSRIDVYVIFAFIMLLLLSILREISKSAIHYLATIFETIA